MLESLGDNTIFDFRFSIKQLGIRSNTVASELIYDPKSGKGSAVSLQLIAVGKRHCRVLYIIPVQRELISIDQFLSILEELYKVRSLEEQVKIFLISHI